MTQSTSSLPAKWKWTLFSCPIKTWIGSLSNDKGNINKKGKKAIGLDIWQNNNSLHVHRAFLYISLPSLHGYGMQWQQRMYKKMWCTCKAVVLLGQAITFLTFSLSLQWWHLKLPIINFTIPCDQSQTKFSRCKLKFSCWYHLKRLSDSLVVPLFLVRKVGNQWKFLLHTKRWRTKRTNMVRQKLSCTN